MDKERTAAAPAPPQRASIYTLGCRLNQAESRLIADQLRAAGYTLVPFGAPAELGIIHTCVVTREAEAKSRKYIHRFVREHPDAVVAVIGCYAQTAAASIAAMGGVDLIVGNEAKLLLPEFLGTLTQDVPLVVCNPIKRAPFDVPFLEQGPPITRRVNLKIQDGCDFMCSYCYIPFARGRSRSRRLENAVAEARALARRGVRELVLTGVNIGDYNDAGKDLITLVDALDGLEPKVRVRIGSIELTNLPEALLLRMATPGHALMPSLHVPLQSGSDAVLNAMRRSYTGAAYLEFMHRAAETVPGIGLSADVMVGFPGETETDFQHTYDVIEHSPLFHVHVFQYSERPEVAAARLPGKIPAATSKARSEALLTLGREKKRAFQVSPLGEIRPVLFESRRNGLWFGHTDNYLEVLVASPESLENRLAGVLLREIGDDILLGERLD